MIDDLNKRILEEFQKDASITYRILAKKIGVPASTVFSRIKQMKEIINFFSIVLSPISFYNLHNR